MIILNERQQAELKGYADRDNYYGEDLCKNSMLTKFYA
jgi:hypothetical protein